MPRRRTLHLLGLAAVLLVAASGHGLVALGESAHWSPGVAPAPVTLASAGPAASVTHGVAVDVQGLPSSSTPLADLTTLQGTWSARLVLDTLAGIDAGEGLRLILTGDQTIALDVPAGAPSGTATAWTAVTPGSTLSGESMPTCDGCRVTATLRLRSGNTVLDYPIEVTTP